MAATTFQLELWEYGQAFRGSLEVARVAAAVARLAWVHACSLQMGQSVQVKQKMAEAAETASQMRQTFETF